MIHRKEQFKKILEFSLPGLVLAIVAIYTYVKFFQHPYGFSWDPNGKIHKVFIDQPAPTVRVGDQLVQIGPLTWDEFHTDLRKNFFQDIKPGQTTPVIVKRNDQLITVQWVLPGTNRGEVLEQLISEWPLAFVFWLAGALTLLFLHPKDDRWLLLSGFDFLTAIWLAAGGGASSYHIWYSAIVLRMAIWLSVPVYLHLHWVFPRPLGKLPPLVVGVAYVAALGFMIAQWFQLFSQDLYFWGFLIAILGSPILLVVHAIRQPDTRRELRLLLLALFFILIPIIILAVIQAYAKTSFRISSLALLSFPLLPSTYLYAAYRRQLGGLEVRVNRLISAYLFLILLGMFALALLPLLYKLFPTPENLLLAGFLMTLLAAVLSIWGFPVFQNYVERRWLGITLPSKNLPETYSARITTSATLPTLLKLLGEEVFPSLLVRQYAFVRIANGSAKVMLSKNVTIDQIQEEAITDLLIPLRSEHLLPSSEEDQPLGWVRLILPMRFGSDLIGAWLLGRRDPDDLYPQAELSILRSLANQTAIALSNILQTERLRSLYQENINRHEQERLRLAHDLHDSVLNQMAILSMNLDPSSVLPKFKEAYDVLTQRLREIVSDLRPPMLQYGLKPALEELADNLMERNQDRVNVIVDIEATADRYPPDAEIHLFRIVQQACENALQHGHAGKITISGRPERQSIQLTIEDDGAGFEVGESLDLNSLLVNRHFGLAGMMERGNLIGAQLIIDSAPNSGARIRIHWNADA